MDFITTADAASTCQALRVPAPWFGVVSDTCSHSRVALHAILREFAGGEQPQVHRDAICRYLASLDMPFSGDPIVRAEFSWV